MSDQMPVFTIKAKDLLAGPAIEAYRDLCSKYGLHEQAAQVQLAFDEVVRWQSANKDLLQMPSHMHVPAEATP